MGFANKNGNNYSKEFFFSVYRIPIGLFKRLPSANIRLASPKPELLPLTFSSFFALSLSRAAHNPGWSRLFRDTKKAATPPLRSSYSHMVTWLQVARVHPDVNSGETRWELIVCCNAAASEGKRQRLFKIGGACGKTLTHVRAKDNKRQIYSMF